MLRAEKMAAKCAETRLHIFSHSASGSALVSLSDLDHLESLFDSASEISLSPSFALSGFGLMSKEQLSYLS